MNDAAGRLARLAVRFAAEIATPTEQGSRADAVSQGRIRYLQDLGRRLCAEGGLEEPLWVKPSDILPTHQPIEVHHG